MSEKVDKSTILSSLFWKMLERGGAQGIQFVVQIILARLLLPEMYGTLALVTVFINIAKVFIESGLGSALIQKREADNIDFSSVFYLNLILSVLLYILVFFAAPLVSHFYRNDQLTAVLRVLGITLIFGAVNSIQNAYVARNMMFRELFKRTIGALLISGVVGISAAYAGFGVWALVLQQLTNQAAVTVIMWYTIKWRPIRCFSIGRVKTLFSYGSKILLSSLMKYLYNDLRTLVIGRVYSTSALGFYNRGEQFPNLIVTNINSSIQSVMFPALSAHQDDKRKVKDMMRRSIMSSSFFVFPMMIGLAVIAEPMVRILLTDNWLPSVPFVQLFCIAYASMPINIANLQAINALGRSDVFLRLEVVKKIIGLGVLVVTVPLGVYAIAVGNTVAAILFTMINVYPNKRLLDYNYFEQIKDIIPSLAVSIVMGAIIYSAKYLWLSSEILILIQVIGGFIVYITLSKIFRIESYSYIHRTIADMRKKHQ